MKIIKTKIANKIFVFNLVFLGLFLFSAAPVFTQTPGVNGRIAFVSSRDGNSEIYSINPDGTGIRRLTFTSGEDNYPAWSPSGGKIAYLSEIPSNGGQALIKIMNADGSGQQVVTPINFNLTTPNFCSERFALDWSPDGSKIVFQEFGNIVMVNIDGTNQQNITNTSVRESEPSWGLMNQIAYASSLTSPNIPDRGLWIFLTTYPEVFFSNYGYYTCAVSPDLSADGRKLAYIGGNDLIPPGLIFIANPNPPFNERNLEFFNAVTVRWSPDGNHLVFHSLTSNYQNQIGIVDEFGQGRRILTEGFNPTWGRNAVSQITPADFDGDGKADVSVFRPSDRTWYLNQATQGFSATQFGLSTDKITPADFDGDGKTDVAVFRSGTWYIINSQTNSFRGVQFGQTDDVPVPADYDGDGKADVAVYRYSLNAPYDSYYYILNSSNNSFRADKFGSAGDSPVPADYDGDGQADIAVYTRLVGIPEAPPPPSYFSYRSSSSANTTTYQWGLSGDLFSSGDFDGDQRADVTVFRPSDGFWYLSQSTAGFRAFQFGQRNDIPVPADYDGDRKTDIAVFRNGFWYQFLSETNSFNAIHFGQIGDIPIESVYVR